MSPLPIPLPARLATQAEARALAAALFPDYATWQAGLAAAGHQRYHLHGLLQDRLRAVFHWLIQDRPKIYERARFDLTYDLSRRLLDAADSNGFYKALDLHLDGHHRLALRYGFTGNGDGI